MKKIFSALVVASLLAVSFGLTGSPVKANFPDGTGEWADTVFSYLPGLRQDGTALPVELTNAWQALGVAEGLDPTVVVPPSAGVSLGYRGQIVLAFDNTILNQPGADLFVYGVNHKSYEKYNRRSIRTRVRVDISQNGWKWFTVAFLNGEGQVDLGALRWAKYVRLTDWTNKVIFPPESVGYSLDAVKALHTTSDQPWLGVNHDLRWWFIDDNKDNDTWLGYSIKKPQSNSYCNSLLKQAVTFRNNWDQNSAYQDHPFQTAYYSTIGRSVHDGLTMSQLYQQLSVMTCDRYTSRDPNMRELVKTLTRINSGTYLWTVPAIVEVQ